MKKTLFILPILFFTLAVNAQQTEDDVYVGKSKTFGNYKGTAIGTAKPNKGQLNITGKVGTKDNGFTVPKNIVGKRIFIEGIEPGKLIPEKRMIKNEYQKDIQIAATGVRVFI